MGLSPAIMGVTVLAWGNSVGDLVADVALAKTGQPVVALAGCYAGPLFNMLVGLGLALIIKTVMMYPQPYGMCLRGCLPFMQSGGLHAIPSAPLYGRDRMEPWTCVPLGWYPAICTWENGDMMHKAAERVPRNAATPS